MNNTPKKSLFHPAILVAIIGLFGTIIAALIGILPSLKPEPPALILLVNATPTFAIAQNNIHYDTIDMGNLDSGKIEGRYDNAKIVVFVHHPLRNLRYDTIDLFSGKLIRVEKICDIRTNDITSLFHRSPIMDDMLKNGATIDPNYQVISSYEILIDSGCSINFFAQMGPNIYTSLSFQVEYTER